MLIEFDKDYLFELYTEGKTSDKKPLQIIRNMETKRIYAPQDLQPSIPIHPGEILKDELDARGISQRKFAALIGVSYSVLNEVINGKRPVTTEYALKIEAATGISAYIWVNMQSAYNMQIARHDSKLSVILDNIRKAVAVLSIVPPVKAMG